MSSFDLFVPVLGRRPFLVLFRVKPPTGGALGPSRSSGPELQADKLMIVPSEPSFFGDRESGTT